MIPFNQVFARYAKDLLEKQTYPEVRRSPGAPAEAPYDVSAWSLGMQFGVKTEFAKTPLAGRSRMEKVAATPRYVLAASNAGGAWRFPYNGAVQRDGGQPSAEGRRQGQPDEAGGRRRAVRDRHRASPTSGTRRSTGFEVTARRQAPRAAPVLATTLNAPRVGIYQSYDPSMDEGWTRWVLDRYQFDYTRLHNEDIRPGRLRQRFDAIILPDQRANAILDGTAITRRS